ncbi:hypothetical protein psal_cds_76 [Pandoravirus salinus]|uniref:Uncharacterized protein n=1 Tax=Pandoravirus salinus TaxID=1349410 RepID=S4W0A7_9VIRU|nr:hypothetical protein psal_cds_76 [Pandoravirus salinus]AGO83490.1 hypothetical protein psal_cds_76 [Pandoravirus salinus]
MSDHESSDSKVCPDGGVDVLGLVAKAWRDAANKDVSDVPDAVRVHDDGFPYESLPACGDVDLYFADGTVGLLAHASENAARAIRVHYGLPAGNVAPDGHRQRARQVARRGTLVWSASEPAQDVPVASPDAAAFVTRNRDWLARVHAGKFVVVDGDRVSAHGSEAEARASLGPRRSHGRLLVAVDRDGRHHIDAV